jgi:hypothetical protein
MTRIVYSKGRNGMREIGTPVIAVRHDCKK